MAFQKREQELVVATQGRAFYVLDDVPLLYQLNDAAATEEAHLFKPKDAYRFGTGGRSAAAAGAARPAVGENPAGGAVVYYSLKGRPQGEVTIEFLDSAGKSVNKFSSRAAGAAAGSALARRRGGSAARCSARARGRQAPA